MTVLNRVYMYATALVAVILISIVVLSCAQRDRYVKIDPFETVELVELECEFQKWLKKGKFRLSCVEVINGDE